MDVEYVEEDAHDVAAVAFRQRRYLDYSPVGRRNDQSFPCGDFTARIPKEETDEGGEHETDQSKSRKVKIGERESNKQDGNQESVSVGDHWRWGLGSIPWPGNEHAHLGAMIAEKIQVLWATETTIRTQPLSPCGISERWSTSGPLASFFSS